jgi:ubiquinone biosynthesis protein UbiJ
MTDIVQQLHDLYRSHPLVMQAADEIERLRQQVDRLAGHVEQLKVELRRGRP